MNTKEIVQAVEASARRNADHRRHNLAAMPEGFGWWQGDIYIERIAAAPNAAKALSPDLWPARLQLVPGIGVGSQHQVETASLSAIYPRTGALEGPVITTGANGAVVEHPKHGWCVLPANTSYAIGYQRAYSPLGELRRQED